MLATATNTRDTLDRLEIAKPCPVDWESMPGDERIRSCDQCHKNVYNLSGMSRDEAQELILEQEGRRCVRFLRRADGTVLTHDCPVGLARVRRKICNGFVRCAALLCFVFTSLTGCGSKTRNDDGKMPAQSVIQNPQQLVGEIHVPRDCELLLGRIALPAKVAVPGLTGLKRE